jgi:predicted HicB family RNase H-like nuclease
MSKTSSKVKDRYNKKAYDTIILRVPKGEKEVIREQAKSKGMSVNGYINNLIKEDME